MARRLLSPTLDQEPEDLAWRLRWLQRGALFSAEGVRQAVSHEPPEYRKPELALPEQIAVMETWLADHGVLKRTERLIGHVETVRARRGKRRQQPGGTKMDDHQDRQDPQEPKQPPKYVADEAGRSWAEALQHARTRTERQREANAQLREAWGLKRED